MATRPLLHNINDYINQHPGLSSTEYRIVYYTIHADYGMRKGGRFWEGAESVSKKLHVKRSKVSLTWKKMCDIGWLEDTGTKIGRTTQWIIQYKVLQAEAEAFKIGRAVPSRRPVDLAHRSVDLGHPAMREVGDMEREVGHMERVPGPNGTAETCHTGQLAGPKWHTTPPNRLLLITPPNGPRQDFPKTGTPGISIDDIGHRKSKKPFQRTWPLRRPEPTYDEEGELVQTGWFTKQVNL